MNAYDIAKLADGKGRYDMYQKPAVCAQFYLGHKDCKPTEK
jgi:hypothetical protein